MLHRPCRSDADADRHRAERRSHMRPPQVMYGATDAFCNLRRIVRAGARQDDGEFLTTVARRQIVWMKQAADDGHGNIAQAQVAALMAVAVVELLEVVDIDHQHGEGPATLQ